MKKIKKLIALTAVLALFSSHVQGQQYETMPDDSAAYNDSGRASYLSAALPIGALVVAAIIIATTNNNHHHHSSSSSGGRNSSSSSSNSHSH